MADQPFLKYCKGVEGAEEPKKAAPLYVATDETDPGELAVLHDAGCLTFADAGLPDATSAMAYSVDAELYRRATRALTMGCSYTEENARVYRSEVGLEPQLSFDPASGGFNRTSSSARKGFFSDHCDEEEAPPADAATGAWGEERAFSSEEPRRRKKGVVDEAGGFRERRDRVRTRAGMRGEGEKKSHRWDDESPFIPSMSPPPVLAGQ